MNITISIGTRADYLALAHLHYRSGPPATIARVLVATIDASAGAERETPIGVLVVSMPTLSGSWRSGAWPGVFDVGTHTERARTLNRELRCISRVIVDPLARGIGVAVALVAHYLRDPLTPRTEAVASMGNLCPFFARAGMTPMAIRPSSRDQALRRALRDHGLDPVDLCDAPRVARRARARPALGRSLRTWADASRATRAQRHASTERLAVLAARSISHRKVAFVHTFARDAAALAHT
ncbi:MAG: hypothetical protein ACK55O_10390 [Phycisphaerales bacterium]